MCQMENNMIFIVMFCGITKLYVLHLDFLLPCYFNGSMSDQLYFLCCISELLNNGPVIFWSTRLIPSSHIFFLIFFRAVKERKTLKQMRDRSNVDCCHVAPLPVKIQPKHTHPLTHTHRNIQTSHIWPREQLRNDADNFS